MTAVDAAFGDLALSSGADHVVYWRLWDQSEWAEPVGGSFSEDGQFRDLDSGLTFQCARGRLDEFLSARGIVFWGDFLHMASYQRQTADVLSRRLKAPLAFGDALALAHDFYLLRGQPDSVLNRVFSFGSTLAFNTIEDYSKEYGRLLDAFVSRADRVLFRDRYSSGIAEMLRPQSELGCWGSDAAFLLPPVPHVRRDRGMGVFLGRSELPVRIVAAFARSIAERLDVAPEWVDWGGEPTFWPMNSRRSFRLAWPGLEHGTLHPTSAQRLTSAVSALAGQRLETKSMSSLELRDSLARYRVIITDTYHLAVCAWRAGTPAVLVVDAPSDSWNVNSGTSGTKRDKRVELYSQLDALPLLVTFDRHESKGSALDLAPEIVKRLSGEVVAAVQRRVQTRTEQVRRQVVDSLQHLLG